MENCTKSLIVTNSLDWQKDVHLVTKESRIISVTEDKIPIYINSIIMNLASQGILKYFFIKILTAFDFYSLSFCYLQPEGNCKSSSILFPTSYHTQIGSEN